ncbi:MAG: UDP-N-acetylmuramate dehydrogenase [Clostridia bacterium]|nr:UDP-N-acetylmuramate dehydrogenase [Clostridia bacterium]
MEQLLTELQRIHVEWETDCPLSAHSSFRIGGPAALALFPDTREKLMNVLRILRAHQMPITVIGRASNVVFPDAGLRGAVLFTSKYRQIGMEDDGMYVSAGALSSTVANAARDASLTGAEFLYGLPGTVGGAVYMNAGAFGGCMEQICTESEYYDCDNGEIGTLRGTVHAFANRESVYQKHPEWVVLGARLQLKSGNRDQIAATMANFLERRRATQPLELPSAGSVFKRPAGHFAGKLIEDCGLKGMMVGGAQVSQKHAGFIVNRGDATAEDVRRLVEMVRETVWSRTGVSLECEIRFL